jgi:ferrous iron transport protein A
LGFRYGEQVELVRKAPLADPLEFRINGGHISLRRADARAIEIDPAD